MLRNPVIRRFVLREDMKLEKKAGISALCEYSLLSDNVYPILIQIFHTKKGKVVAINFGKNGYMVTMIAGKEPTVVKDGNCLSSSEK